MPPKRQVSDLPFEDTNEDDQGVKRRKTGHIQSVMEDFIELLNPATSGSLADFNTWEERENRWGVVGLNAMVLEARLTELAATTDTEAMDAKLNEIDTSLALKGNVFSNYINRARDKGDVVYSTVAGTLDELIKRIELARKQLPGMPSYWVNCHRKADC